MGLSEAGLFGSQPVLRASSSCRGRYWQVDPLEGWSTIPGRADANIFPEMAREIQLRQKWTVGKRIGDVSGFGRVFEATAEDGTGGVVKADSQKAGRQPRASYDADRQCGLSPGPAGLDSPSRT